jgi:sugar phosphate isomerase/epimerase
MIRIGMSTSCVYPLSAEQSFRFAKLAGFDGVEVMITREDTTQSATRLRELSAAYDVPIMSIHAPVLLLTHFVWGRDPQIKLERSAALARDTGATTVVVHPPFRWQSGYADAFLKIVRSTSLTYGVEIAVENMFPWKIGGRSLKAYSPSWDPTDMDCDAVTLDFSHAALSGANGLDMAKTLGDRLRHVHLCDGSGSLNEDRVFDEHLLPGHGSQPVAETLAYLVEKNWSGQVIAEINTRKAKTDAERLDLLVEAISFARSHTTRGSHAELSAHFKRARKAIAALLHVPH